MSKRLTDPDADGSPQGSSSVQSAACPNGGIALPGGRLTLNVMSIPDVQSAPDDRNIPIDKVGVKGLRYPICVKDRQKGLQHTVGLFDLFVSLPHEFKGTHMSRFIEVLNEFRGEISMEKFQNILEKIKSKLQAQSAHMNVGVPLFHQQGSSHNQDARAHVVHLFHERCLG